MRRHVAVEECRRRGLRQGDREREARVLRARRERVAFEGLVADRQSERLGDGDRKSVV